MPKQVVSTVYSYKELSEQAKEKARDWYRDGNLDYDWWESVYEDAKTIGAFLGWTIDDIYFSGFSSQGDGACFEGHWSLDTVSLKKLQAHAPSDKDLHKIGADFQELVSLNQHRRKLARLEGVEDVYEAPSGSVKQSGHYSHKGCTDFSVDNMDPASEDTLIEISRDFMDWIYDQLEKEHDWLQADEQVAESIMANDYEFDEDGNRV